MGIDSKKEVRRHNSSGKSWIHPWIEFEFEQMFLTCSQFWLRWKQKVMVSYFTNVYLHWENHVHADFLKVLKIW